MSMPHHCFENKGKEPIKKNQQGEADQNIDRERRADGDAIHQNSGGDGGLKVPRRVGDKAHGGVDNVRREARTKPRQPKPMVSEAKAPEGSSQGYADVERKGTWGHKRDDQTLMHMNKEAFMDMLGVPSKFLVEFKAGGPISIKIPPFSDLPEGSCGSNPPKTGISWINCLLFREAKPSQNMAGFPEEMKTHFSTSFAAMEGSSSSNPPKKGISGVKCLLFREVKASPNVDGFSKEIKTRSSTSSAADMEDASNSNDPHVQGQLCRVLKPSRLMVPASSKCGHYAIITEAVSTLTVKDSGFLPQQQMPKESSWSRIWSDITLPVSAMAITLSPTLPPSRPPDVVMIPAFYAFVAVHPVFNKVSEHRNSNPPLASNATYTLCGDNSTGCREEFE